MTISPLSRRKTNAHIRELGPSELRAKAKVLPRNIFGPESIPLEELVKNGLIWARPGQKSKPKHG